MSLAHADRLLTVRRLLVHSFPIQHNNFPSSQLWVLIWLVHSGSHLFKLISVILSCDPGSVKGSRQFKSLRMSREKANLTLQDCVQRSSNSMEAPYILQALPSQTVFDSLLQPNP